MLLGSQHKQGLRQKISFGLNNMEDTGEHIKGCVREE